jgi:hypothetical protein
MCLKARSRLFGELKSKGVEVATIRSLEEISVILSTKMALGHSQHTIAETRRLLGWSENRMNQFFSGKYDLSYTELRRMLELLDVDSKELFRD